MTVARHCECPVDHSVDKLGHVAACPEHRSGQPTMIKQGLGLPAGSRPAHADGNGHDFTWATYAGLTPGMGGAPPPRLGACECGTKAFAGS